MLVPVFTRYLLPSEYGVLSTIGAMTGVVTPLVILGVTTLLNVDYFKKDRAEFGECLTTLLLIPVASVIVCTVLVALVAGPLSQRWSIPASWIISIPFLAFLALIPSLVQNLYQLKQKVVHYSLFLMAQTLINMGLSVWMVVGLHLNWRGRMYAFVATNVLFSIGGLWALRRMGHLTLRFSSRYLKEALIFGASLIPHGLGNQIIGASDRLFLVPMMGLSQAGQYAVGIQAASAMQVLVIAFQQAWMPYLFGSLKDANSSAKRRIIRQSYGMMALFVGAFVLLNVIGVPLLYRFFINERYAASRPFVFWISLAFMLQGFYLMVINYIWYAKKAHIMSVLTMINAGCSAVLNYTLIRRFGAIGAAYASAATMLIVFVVAWIVSNWVSPMPWRLRRVPLAIP